MTGTQPARDLSPAHASTVGIVTTFHPEPGLTNRLRAALAAVSRVVIVDNGSTPSERQEMKGLETAGIADVIWNDENRGLAGALNQGFEAALTLGADWALLLDQDSRAEPDIVREAAHVFTRVQLESVAAIGAGFVGRDSGLRGAHEHVSAVITSGTIVSVDAWRTLGGFREDFFVDYVDLEFCLRARANGYAILRSRVPSLHHSIGEPQRRQFVWRKVTVTHHSTDRRYAITRNRLILWRTYATREPAFVLHDVTAFLKETAKILAFESDRLAKLRSTLIGLRDGARVARLPVAHG